MMYWIAWYLFRFVLRFFGRWQVVGAGEVPLTGPVILASNHVSFLDPPTVGAGVRRRMWFMGKDELFRLAPVRWLFTQWQAFPVRRGSGDRAALKRSLDMLAKGEALVIFPEGTRQEGGELGEAELGVGMIAIRSGAPVVPVLIRGTDQVLPRGAWYPRFGRVRIRYGAPRVYQAAGAKPGREDYAAAAADIMQAIARLDAR